MPALHAVLSQPACWPGLAWPLSKAALLPALIVTACHQDRHIFSGYHSYEANGGCGKTITIYNSDDCSGAIFECTEPLPACVGALCVSVVLHGRHARPHGGCNIGSCRPCRIWLVLFLIHRHEGLMALHLGPCSNVTGVLADMLGPSPPSQQRPQQLYKQAA